MGLLLAHDRASSNLVVIAPIRNGPAQRAGIQRGDVLTVIDGQATDDMSTQRASSLLRGKSGSNVSMQVRTATRNVGQVIHSVRRARAPQLPKCRH